MGMKALTALVAEKEAPKIGTRLSRSRRIMEARTGPFRQLNLTWVPKTGQRKDLVTRLSNALKANRFRFMAV